jgi:hypothetical protein
MTNNKSIDSIKNRVLLCLRYSTNLSTLADLGKYKRYLEDEEQLTIDTLSGELDKKLQMISMKLKFIEEYGAL